MPVQIHIDSNARAVVAQSRRMRSQMLAALRQGLDTENNKTLRALTLGRMGYSSAGPVQPDGLRRISSTAVRSLRATPAVNEGQGVTSSFGSNLRYVIAHEFGFVGAVFVRAHGRANKRADIFRVQVGQKAAVRSRAKFGAGADRTIAPALKIFGNVSRANAGAQATRKNLVASGRSFVRAHEMNMNLPARHMIRDTLAERVPAYASTLSSAIVTTWNDLLAVSARAPLTPISGPTQ